MKKAIITTLTILVGLTLFAQAPESFSYQAVLRKADGSIIANQQASVVVEILSGTTDGPPAFTETHSVTTTAQGIVSMTIGSIEDLAVIDWAADTYFLKVIVDDVVLGITQLLSVPYALHAKTADTAEESDPVFNSWDKSTGIAITESQVTDLQEYITSEVDPAFNVSVAKGITAVDTANWNSKLEEYTETDPQFSAWDKSTGIIITESQISDLGSYIESESDPAVAAYFDFADATTGDLLQFNGTKWVKVTPDYISDYTVTESDVTAHQAALAITESQIIDLENYLEAETDPIYSLSVASSISATDTANWNSKLDSYTETDPVYSSSASSGIVPTDITNWNSKIDEETDPVFSEWDKSSGISITESQISDLGSYLEVETQNLDNVLTINNSAGNKSITDLANPVNSQDATTKVYVDALKQQIRVLEDNLISTNNYKLIDVVGNEYEVVRIGGQVWMSENLKTTKYNDGTSIPLVTDATEWSGLLTPGYCWYENDSSTYAQTYGALYNFYTIETQKICPIGWHVPSDDEWKELEMFLGMTEETSNMEGFRGTTEGSKMAGNEILWIDGLLDSNTEFGQSGLNILPAGERQTQDGLFYWITTSSLIWSQTEENSFNSFYRSFNWNYSNINRNVLGKRRGMSIRCIRD